MIAGLELALAAVLWTAQAEDSTPCAQLDPATFVLEGPVNQAMADCVRETLEPTTTVLIVDSGGGDISTALDIAERLEGLSLTVRVRDRCYSSCANYFLPLARRLVVEPGATIVLHGGADPLLLGDVVDERRKRVRDIRRDHPDLSREQAEARADAAEGRIRELIERQRRFAERHNVGPGWFLYREADDEDVGRWLSGRRGPLPHPFGWRLLLAEEPMVRSCLPDVEVEPFQAALQADFIDNRSRYARFRRAQGLRSATLQCAEPTGG